MNLTQQTTSKSHYIKNSNTLRPWMASTLLCLSWASYGGQPALEIIEQLPANAKTLDVNVAERDGKTYTFIRFLDAKNNLQTQAFDAHYRPISENAVPKKKRQWISERLFELMHNAPNPNIRFMVDIGLLIQTIDDHVPLIIGSGEILSQEELRKGRKPEYQLNGLNIDADTLVKSEASSRNSRLKQLRQLTLDFSETLNSLIVRHNWENQETIHLNP